MLRKFVRNLNSQKTKALFVCCYFLFSLNLFGQENNEDLYLISGNIYNDIPGSCFSYLLKLENKSLDTLAVLSTDSTKLRFIKAYHDQRKVIILKDGYIFNSNYTLQVLSMDNPLDDHELCMGDGNNIFEKNLVEYNDSLYYVFENAGKYCGVNINNFNKCIFDSPEILTKAIIKGVVGGLMENKTFDYVLLGHNVKGDSIFISIGGKKYYYESKIPDSLISIEKKYYAIQIDNDNYRVIWNKSSDYKQVKTLGWSVVLIYEKESQKWYSYKLSGNIVNTVNFNNWIAGWVTEGFDSSGGFFWESPGQNTRKKNNNKFCSTYDERASDLAVYMPGILYLYNLETRQHIEWETNQGDSEILYVNDDVVYYRENDKIIKRSILCGNEISLGDPKLIIQNEIIIDVHWGF